MTTLDDDDARVVGSVGSSSSSRAPSMDARARRDASTRFDASLR
jgi:hypothetical protein